MMTPISETRHGGSGGLQGTGTEQGAIATQPYSTTPRAASQALDELRALPQWVAWRYDHGRKIPVDPGTGRNASASDFTTWRTYDLALDRAQRSHLAGIGFVFTEDGPYTGIDFDDCIDAGGELNAQATYWLARLNSYSEVSPSGTGVKVWVRGRLPANFNESAKLHVEGYSHSRYFTFTGQHLAHTPAMINDAQPALDELYAWVQSQRRPERERQIASYNGDLRSDLAEVREALTWVDPWSDGYDWWLRLLMAVHSSFPNNDGLAVADAWAKGYDGEVEAKWRSFKTNGNGTGKVTLATLFDEALRHGWRRQAPSANGHGATPVEAASNAAYDPESARPLYPLTDAGNGERFASAHGANLRFNFDAGAWFVWDGTRWAADVTGAVIQRAKLTARAIRREADNVVDPQQHSAIVKHAHRSESRAALESMVRLAATERGLTVLQTAFDGDPWELNVQNGIVDLRLARLMAHSRGSMCAKLAPVAYDQAATCPTWLAFLSTILAGNQALIGFLQRAIGYSLTGSVSEQCLFILHGSGRNGKSTLLNTLLALMGDYGQRAPRNLLIAQSGDSGPSPEMARLQGARFVVAQETGEGERLDEVGVKELSGGDRLVARFLHRNYFEFAPSHKIWLATNHRPTVRGTDLAVWRRIRLIPFGVTIPDRDIDPALSDKLLAELPGILRWALDGSLEWQCGGLRPPSEVVQATARYRDDMDVLGAFISDCCLLDPRATATKAEMFRAFEAWALANGERVVTKRELGRRLVERGFDEVQLGKNRDRAWLGIGLLASTP